MQERKENAECLLCQEKLQFTDPAVCLCPPYFFHDLGKGVPVSERFVVATCGVEFGRYEDCVKAMYHCAYLYHALMLEYNHGTVPCYLLHVISKSCHLGGMQSLKELYAYVLYEVCYCFVFLLQSILLKFFNEIKLKIFQKNPVH